MADADKSRKPKTNAFSSLDDSTDDLARHAGKLKLTDTLAGQQPADDREKDRSGWATRDQVLDDRTRQILLRLINNEAISELHGCIATGKEANVYYAFKAPADHAAVQHRAIKVYKTSTMQFKARSKYVEGDHRFQAGYDNSSSRAIAKQWAQKEMRNLQRIHRAEIPCPRPIELRDHVLVMSFLGDAAGVPSPRLKDVRLQGDGAEEVWRSLYGQLLGYMRTLHRDCQLVHADLSEYNTLYHEGRLHLIDVSQSVDPSHPEYLNFWRMDIKNMTHFFGRQGVQVLSEQTVFDFVFADKDDISVEELLEQGGVPLVAPGAANAEDAVGTEVYRSQHLPRTLHELDEPERYPPADQEAAPFQRLLADPSDPADQLDSGSSGSSDSEDADGSTDSNARRPPRGRRFEDKEEKRQHKRQVKEEKRERRKDKMPKKVKKSLVKKTASRKD